MANAFDSAQFIHSTGDAIIAADAGGAIVFWNAAAARVFGFTEQEALGRPLDIIIPERLRERHGNGYNRTMATGETRYGNDVLRVPAMHKDGHTLSIAFTVTLLRAINESSRIIVATVRDETERWQRERALDKHVAELEAKVRER